MELKRRFCFLLSWLLLSLTVSVSSVGAGCSRSAPAVRTQDLVPMTTDVLTRVLLGPSPNETLSSANSDPPVLRPGIYETALIAVDSDGFARESRGALSVKEIAQVHEKVVARVNDTLKRQGYRAKLAPFPLETATEPKAVGCVLTPAIEEADSPEDKANGRARRLVLVVLTITDATTGQLLTERRFYSGADARPGERRK